MYLKNRYNFEVLPERVDPKTVTGVEELVPVFNKESLKQSIFNQQPTQGKIRLIQSDVDMSKMSTPDRFDYLLANPDQIEQSE